VSDNHPFAVMKNGLKKKILLLYPAKNQKNSLYFVDNDTKV